MMIFKRILLYKDSTPLFLFLRGFYVAVLKIALPNKLNKICFSTDEGDMDTSLKVHYKKNLLLGTMISVWSLISP